MINPWQQENCLDFDWMNITKLHMCCDQAATDNDFVVRLPLNSSVYSVFTHTETNGSKVVQQGSVCVIFCLQFSLWSS